MTPEDEEQPRFRRPAESIHAVPQIVSSSATTGMRFWSTLAAPHMEFAAYCARQSGLVEQAPRESDAKPYTGYVAAAVIMAAASLEAAINEVYRGAVDGARFYGSVSGPVRTLLATIWPVLEAHRASTLDKYQIALRLAGTPPFPRGEDPYQSAADVLVLRNALVHFKPEWRMQEDADVGLEARLQGKFQENPLSAPTEAYFPKRCLSYDCACWAVNSLINLIQEFAIRIEIPERFRGLDFDLAIQDRPTPS